MVVDFDRIVDLDHAAVSQRRKMSFNGSVFVSLVFDLVDDDILDMQISTLGLFDMDTERDQKHFEDLESYIERAIDKMPAKERRKEKPLEEKIISYAKRYFRELFDVRPLVEVHITFLD
jgi:mRNA degradation ribonuclease J1/J2